MCLMKLENMSEFNFKSSPCTSREQSERLLALGLKKETADMKYPCTREYYGGVLTEGISSLPIIIDTEDDDITEYDIPAWSLHRLIKLAYGNWNEDIVPVYLGNSYDMLIGRIEFQIKQGKFNKEYLV